MSDAREFTLSDGTLVRPGIPFFITGAGRCGTTLMRRLVIERTGAVIPPENNSLASSVRMLQAANGDWPVFCSLVVEHLGRYSGGLGHFGMDEAVFGLLAALPAPRRNVADFWHAFHAIYATLVGKASGTRWGDKSPSNTVELPCIVQIFPAARFVFMLRDVFDMAYSYGSMAIPRRSGQFLGGAKRWVLASAKMVAFAEQYPEQVLFLSYEDLVRTPDASTQRVLDHLALPIVEPVALNPMEARDIITHPHLGNVLGDVRPDFIGKGRAMLTVEQKQRIAAIAAPWQIRFGYEPNGLTPLPFPAN